MGMSRTESRLATCPYCEAPPGQPCRREDGKPRPTSHQERVDAAFKMRPPRKPRVNK